MDKQRFFLALVLTASALSVARFWVDDKDLISVSTTTPTVLVADTEKTVPGVFSDEAQKREPTLLQKEPVPTQITSREREREEEEDDDDDDRPYVSTTPAPATPPVAPVVAPGSKTVQTIASYSTPSGTDRIGFSLIIDQSGTITNVTIQNLANSDTSANYQRDFAASAPAVLVGKKLSTLTSINRVARASLTTMAFNDSLPALKAQL